MKLGAMGTLAVVVFGFVATLGCGAAPEEGSAEPAATESEAVLACQNPVVCTQACVKWDPNHTLDGHCCFCNNACGKLYRDVPNTPSTLYCR